MRRVILGRPVPDVKASTPKRFATQDPAHFTPPKECRAGTAGEGAGGRGEERVGHRSKQSPSSSEIISEIYGARISVALLGT